MLPVLNTRRSVVVGILLILAVFLEASSVQTVNKASLSVLEPTPKESKAAMQVTRDLARYHYLQPQINSQFSQVVFKRYLKDLDPSHSYFMASDIQEFQQWQDSLAVSIPKGDLTQAFAIYNRFQQRMAERLNYELMLVKNKKIMNFSKPDSLETNREHVPWISTPREMNALWLKRVKATELGLVLAGKKPNDVIKLLTKRYQTQLSHLYQTRADDAFQIFMDSLTESIDPHTEYFSPRVSENFNINMSLSLEGIGAVLQTEDEFTKVVRLVTGGPAEKGHQLKPGDRIVAVAQGSAEFVDVIGWRIDEVVDLIRGPKGSVVRLQVLPAGSHDEHQTHVVTITRNTVALQDQAAKSYVIHIERNKIQHSVGVIELPAFYADFQAEQDGDPNYRSTTRDVRSLLAKLEQQHIEGLVIDLRNNGGGALKEANELVGLFIGAGPTVQVRDSEGHLEVLGNQDSNVLTYSGSMVVLVNRLSASASEIFTGAIQDYHRGLIVGSTTYGKGSVQSLMDVGYGQLKVTEAKFYRISGGSNQTKGIVPDLLFPSLVDDKDIGESAQQNAMPWDSIAPVQYQVVDDFKTLLPKLKNLDQPRISKDPDFIYTNEELAVIHEQRTKTLLSLQESVRKLEQDTLDKKQLEIENRKRVALGKPALKSLSAKEDDSENIIGETPSDAEIQKDGFLRDAGNILLDWNSMIHVQPVTPPVALK